MAKRTDKESKDTDTGDKGVVDSLLTELGVDDEMRQELISSGRMSTDVMRIESADQVRRRTEIEKSMERLRDSISLLERNIMTVDGTIDRIERDLVPVVLSFLVTLKGQLVNMRGDIVNKSKKKAKTNLQATYMENDVRPIVEAEFARVEESLTTGMSTPILEKMRDVTESLKESLKLTFEELSTLKGSIDDYTQRATTEIEFLTKEIGMKPRVEVPKDIEEKIRAMERRIEEMQNKLEMTEKKLANREAELEDTKRQLIEVRLRNDDLEEDLAKLSTAPKADKEALIELRNKVKSVEASRDVLAEKLKEAEERADRNEARIREILDESAKKDIQIGDLQTKLRQVKDEIDKAQERMAEMEELRARLRSYESGDKMRELERIRAEHERAMGNLERMTEDYKKMREELEHTKQTIDGYMSLMENTEKTKAFLMVEENEEMSIREIARALGVSQPIVMKWAEEFQSLGIAWVIDGTTLVHRDAMDKRKE
ncbi:MAG: hypothetical protein ACP6KW_08265 [Candidatus Thorarchaeota archaeon]